MVRQASDRVVDHVLQFGFEGLRDELGEVSFLALPVARVSSGFPHDTASPVACQRLLRDSDAEIGFAAAIGRRSYGLRADRRDSGEFGLPMNLQVLHFMEKSGGRLFRRIEDIEF